MADPANRADAYFKEIQRNDLKGHADRIIQGIKKIGPSHAKRAVWELFQNAVDLSAHCEIAISLTENELIFSHNGIPFTTHTLDCLFTQVSSKTPKKKILERAEEDPVGQYGTGFMTSHAFGDVVKISGAICYEDRPGAGIATTWFNTFQNLIVDRSTQDWELMCDQISMLRKKVGELLLQSLVTGDLPATEFRYELKSELNRKRALDAVESLRTILPYVMIFNERLKKVCVRELNGYETIYEKAELESNNEDYYSRLIKVNNETVQLNYLKTERLFIVIPFVEKNDQLDYLGQAYAIPDSVPRLFLFYPLIGTERFGFNFVIHSKNFQPTEPRDGVYLQSDNEKNKFEEQVNQSLMEEASISIFDFLEKQLVHVNDAHLLADLNFAVNSESPELRDYFNKLKAKWTDKFKTLPFVDTASGRIALQDAIFLDSIVIEGASPETLAATYKIASSLFTNLPRLELIEAWSKLIDLWNLPDTKRIRFSDLADQIQAKANLDLFDKSDLILFYKEVIRKGQGELFASKALLPNIKGQFRKQIELSKSVDLSEDLIRIADLLNPKISNRQIHDEFILDGLDFEVFGRRDYMASINNSLDEHIKDGTKAEQLPPDYLSGLIQYAKIAPNENSETGAHRVIKWIEAYYDLKFDQIVLPAISGEADLDVRKGQNDLFRVFLNDLSSKDSSWIEPNIGYIASVLSDAFSNQDIKKIFIKYDIFPNQSFEFRSLTSLSKDNGIPSFVKFMYNTVVDPPEPIESRLAHSIIENIGEEMKITNASYLTQEIENRFYGHSGNEISIDNNPYRPHILDIVKNLKSDQPDSKTYERLFPATFRNKSAILVQLADGDASFTILSQDESVVKKLAGIAAHPDLDQLLELGKAALQRKYQDSAELSFKLQIGNHLERVLQEHFTNILDAKVVSQQGGQDLIVYVDSVPVYYIEVKSKWQDTTPIRITETQTMRAYENPSCYALCSIDMTDYTGADKYEIESLDCITSYMKFNTDIGLHVSHLIPVYQTAHQRDKFSLDGDYRTLIPSDYISSGIGLVEFEKELVSHLKRINDKQDK